MVAGKIREILEAILGVNSGPKVDQEEHKKRVQIGDRFWIAQAWVREQFRGPFWRPKSNRSPSEEAPVDGSILGPVAKPF